MMYRSSLFLKERREERREKEGERRERKGGTGQWLFEGDQVKEDCS